MKAPPLFLPAPFGKSTRPTVRTLATVAARTMREIGWLFVLIGYVTAAAFSVCVVGIRKR